MAPSVDVVEFVRASATPEEYDGVWQVWRGTRCYGTVSRGPDPERQSEAWGYKSKPFGSYPNGQRCLYGWPSRKAAGAALVALIERCEDPA